MPTASLTTVNALRQHAVRGTLTPGLYRHFMAVHTGTPFYEDIYVEEAHVPGGQYTDGKPEWFTYVSIDPTHFAYGRPLKYDMNKGSLKDAGVIPQREGKAKYVVKKCDLGCPHLVMETTEPRYNENFIVPLAVAVTVK